MSDMGAFAFGASLGAALAIVYMVLIFYKGRALVYVPWDAYIDDTRDIILEEHGWVYTTIPNEYGAVTHIHGVPWYNRMFFRFGYQAPLRKYLTRLAPRCHGGSTGNSCP